MVVSTTFSSVVLSFGIEASIAIISLPSKCMFILPEPVSLKCISSTKLHEYKREIIVSKPHILSFIIFQYFNVDFNSDCSKLSMRQLPRAPNRRKLKVTQ